MADSWKPPQQPHPQLDLGDVRAGVQRTRSETDRDAKYADYWLEEYGSDPDAIRINHVFPELQKYVAKYAIDGMVYDFGCGAGSALREVRSWNTRRYLGIDVNQKFLDCAKQTYGDEHTSFIRRNFDQSGWENGLTPGFDLGLSIFVWNELRNPRVYLKGIRRLCKPAKGVSATQRSRLALVFTHPVMVLKDISDFYLGRSNSRKLQNIESYKSPESGQYTFSRGDFSVPFQHWPFTDVFRLFQEERWRVEEFVEIFYSDATTTPDQRSQVSNQYPKFVLFVLKG